MIIYVHTCKCFGVSQSWDFSRREDPAGRRKFCKQDVLKSSAVDCVERSNCNSHLWQCDLDLAEPFRIFPGGKLLELAAPIVTFQILPGWLWIHQLTSSKSICSVNHVRDSSVWHHMPPQCAKDLLRYQGTLELSWWLAEPLSTSPLMRLSTCKIRAWRFVNSRKLWCEVGDSGIYGLW